MKNNSDLLTYKQPEPNKAVIKEMLQGGFDIPHAELTVRNNMSIKIRSDTYGNTGLIMGEKR